MCTMEKVICVCYTYIHILSVYIKLRLFEIFNRLFFFLTCLKLTDLMGLQWAEVDCKLLHLLNDRLNDGNIISIRLSQYISSITCTSFPNLTIIAGDI